MRPFGRRPPALSVLFIVSVPVWAHAQPPAAPEGLARRQFASGQQFLTAGKFTEALKDFQTVVDSYPGSTVADDALLAIARYQLEIARDAGAAQSAAESLLKKFPTSDSVPMAYVVAGRAMVARSTAAANVDAALASFERVPRLFPGSEAIAPAVFAAGETLTRLGRCDEALDRFDHVVMEYPRTNWASEARLSSARCLVAAGRPFDAMTALQRVIDASPASPQAHLARQWNTILYRLYIRVPAQPPYLSADRSISGPAGRLKDVSGLAVGPGDALFVGTRSGVMQLDDNGAPVRSFGTGEARGFIVDGAGKVVLVQKALLEQESAPSSSALVTLTAPRDGGPAKVLGDLTAVAILSTGERLVADRSARAVYRFDAAGRFVAPFASVRASRVVVGPADVVALLDRDTKSVAIVDRTGKPATRIAPKGAGYELSNPSDLAFDGLGHLYVLDREGVFVFTPAGRLLASFSSAPGTTAGALRDASALALDESAQLFIYDGRSERVQVYR